MTDTPPDPGARHELACRECGAPLHPDQAACLSCGAMVAEGDDRTGIRRAVVGSAAALLVLGGAVGAAVAGLPNGKHVGKPTIAQVLGKKPAALPPATVSPGAGSSPIAPLPGSTSGTRKPPKIHPAKPKPSKATSTGTGSAAGSKSTGGSESASKKNNPSGSKKHAHHRLKVFKNGAWPDDAGVFAGGPQVHAGSVANVMDRVVTTAWSTQRVHAGVWVRVINSGYKALGIVSKAPGYNASVYYYSKDTDPPATLSDWTNVGTISNGDNKHRFDLLSDAARTAHYYLIVITALPSKGSARINEIQLLP